MNEIALRLCEKLSMSFTQRREVKPEGAKKKTKFRHYSSGSAPRCVAAGRAGH